MASIRAHGSASWDVLGEGEEVEAPVRFPTPPPFRSQQTRCSKFLRFNHVIIVVLHTSRFAIANTEVRIYPAKDRYYRKRFQDLTMPNVSICKVTDGLPLRIAVGLKVSKPMAVRTAEANAEGPATKKANVNRLLPKLIRNLLTINRNWTIGS